MRLILGKYAEIKKDDPPTNALSVAVSCLLKAKLGYIKEGHSLLVNYINKQGG